MPAWGDDEHLHGNRFRISCLTCIIVSGSMAAEDISGVDDAIADVDMVWSAGARSEEED